ncbi:DNA mismatch repair protein Mlh1 [Folsomia candida]|uniref:DNA mismatch repair protein Mlh1 n=1 Tax=Folsomia candida TaxID=158441 RepID=A0A226CXQ6_FOLCA|nr:DNA mismatch repair protein Mlh1 [Folsomia candida]
MENTSKMEKVPGKIQKLDETVVNRIAAGEVIQRPANALKELLENSLDAGSKNIQVLVKAGGMKLLQIQDDGSGIREEDLSIVCERFTTSKLQKFEDLQTIGTYGFRGEALASISHVAHLSILTKTETSQCAFKAEYTDGKLKDFPEDAGVQNPKKCAGKQGTTLIVEDLFYNMETRRKALKNASDEHSKIFDVISRYAIHNAQCGFSLKKFGDTNNEIRTPANSSILDNIKIIYGAAIARELIQVSCDDSVTKFKMQGYVSNVNYSTKKSMFTLFINHRLVDSTGLRKSVEAVYSNYLPKGMHPFAYLSIEVEPRNVDVNVHPTKHEVHFLHEDAIISSITAAIENLLLGANESRTFLVQSLLPGASGPTGISMSVGTGRKCKDPDSDDSLVSSFSAKSGRTVINPKHMVRTDPKLQKLDRFLSSTLNPDVSTPTSFHDTPSRLSINVDNEDTLIDIDPEPIKKPCDKKSDSRSSIGAATASSSTKSSTPSSELFYQKLIFQFGNFEKINIDDKIELKELIDLAIECDDGLTCDEQKETVVENACQLLMDKRKMLQDYFSLIFDSEGRLISIPMLLDNYFPSMEGLAKYMMNLARKVDWSNEQRCFETFCDVTSQFYAIQPGDDNANAEMTWNGHSWKWTIEHVIFPELQKNFLPPKIFAEDSCIVQLTTLPELYKVFERC